MVEAQPLARVKLGMARAVAGEGGANEPCQSSRGLVFRVEQVAFKALFGYLCIYIYTHRYYTYIYIYVWVLHFVLPGLCLS